MTTWSGPLTGDDGSIVDVTITTRSTTPTPADVSVSVSSSPASPQQTGATITITASVSPTAAAGSFVLTQDGVTTPLATKPAVSGSATFTVALPSTATSVNYFVTFNADDPVHYKSGVSAGPVAYTTTAPAAGSVPDTIVINGVSHAVDGVNVPRGDGQLILYTTDIGGTTPTNQWGTEAATQTTTNGGSTTYSTIAPRGTATKAGATSGTSVSPALPSGLQDGDYVVVWAEVPGSATSQLTAPSGWTQLFAPFVTPDTNICGAWYRKHTTASPVTSAPVISTSAAADATGAVCMAFSGIDGTTPLDTTSTTAKTNPYGSSIAPAALTTATDGALVLSGGCLDETATAITGPSGMTLTTTTAGSSRALGLAYATQATHGATGTKTWSFSSSYGMGAFLAAFRPASTTTQGSTTTTIASKVDRAAISQTTGSTIPAKPNFVISGHNSTTGGAQSADWVGTNAVVGATVVLKAGSNVITSWPGTGGGGGGPTAPTTPTGVAATAGDTKADLTWAAVNGATSYNVYQGSTKVASVTTTGTTVTGLTNGTAYSFKVSAVNSVGESPLSAAVSVTPTATVSSGALYFLGASGEGVGNGHLNAWMTNHALRMVGTWSDQTDDTTGDFSQLTGEFGSWTGPIDVAVGGLRNGQDWASAAAGAYNPQWQTRFNNLKAAWGSRPASNLWVRIAHEFNGNFSDYFANDGDAANFVQAWRRWATILRTTIPGAHPVWSPNDGGNVTNIDAFWPGNDLCDAIAVDHYNAWPHYQLASDINAHMGDKDSHGNPVGPEAWRQYALSKGVPMSFGEIGNPSNSADQGGGGDAPAFFTVMDSWCKANAAASDVLTNPKGSPGKIFGAVWFNIGDGVTNYPAHYRFWVDSTGAADSTQPNFAAAFQAATIQGTGPTPPPPPPPPTGTTYPPKEIAVYKMMWAGDQPPLSSINSKINVVRLSFATGSGPAMVGDGVEGLTNLKAAISNFRARGGRLVVSLGGGDQPLDPSNTSAFVNGLAAIRDRYGALDGIDWDWETGWNDSQVHAVNLAAVAKFGSDFAITFAQNGGNVESYIPTIVKAQNAGILTSAGQQFYESPVSYSAALGRVDELINAGIPASKISIGMMIASDSSHWTNAQCKQYMTQFKADRNITRCYLWEASRTGTDQWASDMAGILGL